jgi:NAD(P)H dehydrogenase (quinone)
MLIGFVPMHRLDRFDRRQQHPNPTHPQYSGQSAIWRAEHTAQLIAPTTLEEKRATR